MAQTPGAWVQSCSLGSGTQLQGTLEMTDGATTVTCEVRKGLHRRVPLKHPATAGWGLHLKAPGVGGSVTSVTSEASEASEASERTLSPSTEVGGDPPDVTYDFRT